MEELLVVILPGNEQVLIGTKRYLSVEYAGRTVPFSWFLPKLKYTGLRIATETRPIHNTDDMGIRVGLRTAPVAIMEEMRNARQI